MRGRTLIYRTSDRNAIYRLSQCARKPEKDTAVGRLTCSQSVLSVIGCQATERSHELRIRGIDTDAYTRCAHYDSERDIIAIRFRCCGVYYPCHACHEALADHAAEQWPQERFGEHAVLCGACRKTLSIRSYLDCGHVCPHCSAEFNPGCAAHHELYFAIDN